ncbi:hypothetical protein LXL04_003149 [Taraxacum kok-saghyz]
MSLSTYLLYTSLTYEKHHRHLSDWKIRLLSHNTNLIVGAVSGTRLSSLRHRRHQCEGSGKSGAHQVAPSVGPSNKNPNVSHVDIVSSEISTIEAITEIIMLLCVESCYTRTNPFNITMSKGSISAVMHLLGPPCKAILPNLHSKLGRPPTLDALPSAPNLRPPAVTKHHATPYLRHPSIMLLFLLCFLISYHQKSYAVDTMVVAESITDGDTVTSAGRIFKMGFFSPGIPRIGTFQLLQNQVYFNFNTLVIAIIIVPKLSSSSTEFNPPVLQLLDIGYLVIRDENDKNPESFHWQSFDYPVDTLLPGMKLKKKKKKKTSTQASKPTFHHGKPPTIHPQVITLTDLITQGTLN